MGAVGSILGYEKEDIHGNRRSFVAQCVDPVGACVQPAAFGLYNPNDHLPEDIILEDSDPTDPATNGDTPTTPPPPAAM